MPRVADLPVRPLNILYDSVKAVPAVKYAFGVVGMAAAGMLVTGFLGADWPKIIAILFGAMALLFVFSLLTRSASKVKYAAEVLCWTVVIGVATVAVGAMSFAVSGEPHRLGVLLGLARDVSLQTAPPPVPMPVNEVQDFAHAQQNLWKSMTCALSGEVKCPSQPASPAR
jgi:hypothetical protein